MALRGFSRAGRVAVTLVLVSGAADTVLVLRRWPTHRSSPYQALLAVEVVVVGLMMWLALVNRDVSQPRSARHAEAATTALWDGTLAAIALVGVFGLLDPG